jgi:cyclic pyranopterin phosphate synthase
VLATARGCRNDRDQGDFKDHSQCHPIPIGGVTSDFSDGDGYIEAVVRVKTLGKTGRDGSPDRRIGCPLTIWIWEVRGEGFGGQYPSPVSTDIRVTEKKKGETSGSRRNDASAL